MSDLIPWHAPYAGRLLVLAVMLMGVALCAWASRRRRTEQPHCPKCRYDLRGSPSLVCPECGHAPAGTAKGRVSLYALPRRRRLAALGVVIAAAMPAFVVQRRVREYGWNYFLRFEPFYSIWPRTKEADVPIAYDIHVIRWHDRRVNDADGGLAWSVSVDGQMVCPIFPSEYLWAIGSKAVNCPEHFLLRDLAGDGTLDLILSSNAGGNASDDFLCILNFDCSTGKARFVREIELQGFLTLIPAADHCTFKYESNWYTSEWTDHAGSPWPTLFLKYQGGRLTLDEERTRRPLPSALQIQDAMDEAADGNYGWYPGLCLAIDMIYAGHAKDGWCVLQAIRAYYPDGGAVETPPSAEDVMQKISDAPFGKEILALSDWPAPATPSPSESTSTPAH